MLPNQIKKAILGADVLQTGHFIFANGDHATIKLEMDNLWEHSVELDLVLKALAKADGLPPADVLLGVPTGGQRLADALGELINIPVIQLERVPGGAKQDFRFTSAKDEQLAKNAKSLRIYEDVVTSLSSIAGVVKLLSPKTQNIHSLAIWRRGIVKPAYQIGITDHYLIEELLPSISAALCTECK